MDIKDDGDGLSEIERIGRSQAQALLFLHLKNRKMLLAQKARVNWLEGVCSKLFFRTINKRRSVNGISGLDIRRVWVDDPVLIKREVFRFFRNQFKERVGAGRFFRRRLSKQSWVKRRAQC